MKNTIKLSIGSLFVALMLMSFTTNSNAPLWVKHVDPTGFSIDFPNAPTRNTPPLGGLVNYVVLKQQTAGAPKFILVFKEKSGAFLNITRVLNDMLNDYATSKSGTIVKTLPVRKWKNGDELTAEVKNSSGLFTHIRIFIKGNCSYLMAVENNGSFAPLTDALKFWDSLDPK